MEDSDPFDSDDDAGGFRSVNYAHTFRRAFFARGAESHRAMRAPSLVQRAPSPLRGTFASTRDGRLRRRVRLRYWGPQTRVRLRLLTCDNDDFERER